MKIEPESSEVITVGRLKLRMLQVQDLPEELQPTFSKIFCPNYVKYIGMSDEPWISPGLKVQQGIFNEMYPGYDVKLTGKDAVSDVVRL